MAFSIVIEERPNDEDYTYTLEMEGFTVTEIDRITPKDRADTIRRAVDGNLDIAYHDHHVEIYSNH